MSPRFGYDVNGLHKRLPDGRVLRVTEQLFNFKLTLSASLESPVWLEGW